MAYSPAKLKLIAGVEYDLDVPRIWAYKSEDAMTTVRAADYFSDALMRRMRPGDAIYVLTVDASDVPQTAYWSTVLSVDADGADITDGDATTLTNS